MIESKVESLDTKVQEAINNFMTYVKEQEDRTDRLLPTSSTPLKVTKVMRDLSPNLLQ